MMKIVSFISLSPLLTLPVTKMVTGVTHMIWLNIPVTLAIWLPISLNGLVQTGRGSRRWHDLGKFRPRFQKYIRRASGFEADAHIKGEAGKAPHSTAGAMLAIDRFGVAGHVLAYLIAGHHAGLDDWFGGLHERFDDPKSREELAESLAESPPDEILDPGELNPAAALRAIPGGKNGFALWVRMLFSALVDADFLDTERYMDPDKFVRRNTWPTLEELTPLFDTYMIKLASQAKPTDVNTLRADILRQCRDAATLEPGLFSLTVPTGGGKTLSSMAFALEHALRHDKCRVIHVIPYTSIIEQTANIFRDIFGDAVIEHHSNAESKPDQETSASRLACENWDAPSSSRPMCSSSSRCLLRVPRVAASCTTSSIRWSFWTKRSCYHRNFCNRSSMYSTF